MGRNWDERYRHTEEQVLSIAKQHGEYFVHKYLYRHEKNRKLVKKMVKNGILKVKRRDREVIFYEVISIPNENGGEND